MKCNNLKAIITGGSRGIGKAVCIELAKQGADVLINYISNKKEAQKTLQEVMFRSCVLPKHGKKEKNGQNKTYF